MFICKYCKDNPTLHTFRIYKDTPEHTIYYSCISESTDKNIEQIIYHINGFLEHNTNKSWSWIIDSRDFKFELYTISLTLELIKIYSKYRNTLIEMQLINMNNWMKCLINICKPFMSTELYEKIKID